EHAPDADPLAVFAPRPVRVVIDISRQIAADDTGTSGIERLRGILGHVPVLEIGRDHDSESLPFRPPKRLSLRNRHKLVFHGSHSRLVEKQRVSWSRVGAYLHCAAVSTKQLWPFRTTGYAARDRGMSAVPPKADKQQTISARPLSAISGQTHRSENEAPVAIVKPERPGPELRVSVQEPRALLQADSIHNGAEKPKSTPLRYLR